MSKVIGIDLGTTNSCVAVVQRDGPAVISNKTGHNTMPSIVATADSGKRLVGHLAKRQAITNPFNTVSGTKRLIGRRWDAPEVQESLKLVSYKCVCGPHNDVRVDMGGKEYAVPEISSMLLHELRVVAERSLGEPIHEAVVTVPAYFNDNQRQATKDAGRIAGLEVLRIINEPTAAALAFGYSKGVHEKTAVYDLGGGTFDISILEIGHGVFEVLSTAGDTFLGGEDFDERIINWLVEGFQGDHGVDLRQDKMAMQRLRDAAETAKIELSTASEVDINLPFIFSPGKGSALHLQRQLSRKQLESLVADLIQRTFAITMEALKRASLRTSDISSIILVGGMTRMPKVQRAVENLFGRTPCKGLHPDEAVAQGAALQGHLLLTQQADTLLLDVTPHDLGIMVVGGLFDVIIERDTTIPTSAKKVFTTVRDNQRQVRILVLQGDSSRADQNELLGEFLLDGLPAAPRGQTKIEVSFEINADGIVSVSARDLATNREQAITVTASSGLTEEEIRRMVEENREAALASERSDAFERHRTDAERLLRDIQKLLPPAREILAGTDFGTDALKKAKEAVELAREAIERRDVEGVQRNLSSLKRTTVFLRNVVAKLSE